MIVTLEASCLNAIRGENEAHSKSYFYVRRRALEFSTKKCVKKEASTIERE